MRGLCEPAELRSIDMSLGRGLTAARVLGCLELDLPAEILDDTLEFAQTLHELDLALAGLLWRGIGILGTWAARGTTWCGKDALDLRLAAVTAGHMLVTADLALATDDAGSGVEGIGRRQ